MTSQETQFGFARSADGRTFSVRTVADELQVGALVALQATGATFLGQVLSAGTDRPVLGVVLGELTQDGLAKGRRPLHRRRRVRPHRRTGAGAAGIGRRVASHRPVAASGK